MENKPVFFAEVIESYLTHFKAQCWDYAYVPPYGSLAVIEQDGLAFYALVHQSFTGTDNMVYAVQAYQKTEEELKRDQPQIFELLKTTFNAVIIAHKQESVVCFSSAPVPAKSHAFVRLATDQELICFVHDFGYLSILFGQVNQVNIDELLVAFVAILQQKKLVFEIDLIELLHTYLLLCSNDYRRVRFLAKRLQ